MKSFDQYYRRDLSLPDAVNELSNPGLDYSKDREQVNDLVINLVIKYIVSYLKLDDRDFEKLNSDVSSAVRNSPQEIMAFLASTIAGLRGEAAGHLSEKMAIQCLCAIKDTSAIFKEIAFNDQFDAGNHFVGVDFGSGTGILMVASLIAARRKKINNVAILGLDILNQAVVESSRVLSEIDPKKNMIVQRADISRMEPYGVFQRIPSLSHWISETFGYLTPKVRVVDDDLEIPMDKASLTAIMSNKGSDPFPFVVGNTLQAIPSFAYDVRGKSTAMFPDLINGLYLPDMDNSSMALRTGVDQNHRRLDKIGNEFDDYQSFSVEPRWQFEDLSQVPQEIQDGTAMALMLAMQMDRDRR